MSTPPSTEQQGAGDSLRHSFEIVGQILIAPGLLTAILFYFGYIRERALFSYFGVPLGSLDFTTSGYLLRSAQAVFGPLVAVFLLATLGLVAHQVIMVKSYSGAPPWWRGTWVMCGGLALGLLALGATGAYFHSLILGPTASAIALGAGAVLLDYSTWMAAADTDLSPAIPAALRRTRLPRRVLLLGVALIAVFWWTLNVANHNGLEGAQAIESSLERRGEAVVLSDKRLGILGHGVFVETLSPDASGFAYRYTGLRVLLHTGDMWVLLPRGWTHGNGDSVVLLPDHTAGVRVDVRP